MGGLGPVTGLAGLRHAMTVSPGGDAVVVPPRLTVALESAGLDYRRYAHGRRVT
jgi:hypothetical protein